MNRVLIVVAMLGMSALALWLLPARDPLEGAELERNLRIPPAPSREEAPAEALPPIESREYTGPEEDTQGALLPSEMIIEVLGADGAPVFGAEVAIRPIGEEDLSRVKLDAPSWTDRVKEEKKEQRLGLRDQAVAIASSEIAYQGTTDKRGRMTLKALRSGAWQIQASAQGVSAITNVIRSTGSLQEVTPGSNSEDSGLIALALGLRRDVQIEVLNENGVGLVGAVVVLYDPTPVEEAAMDSMVAGFYRSSRVVLRTDRNGRVRCALTGRREGALTTQERLAAALVTSSKDLRRQEITMAKDGGATRFVVSGLTTTHVRLDPQVAAQYRQEALWSWMPDWQKSSDQSQRSWRPSLSSAESLIELVCQEWPRLGEKGQTFSLFEQGDAIHWTLSVRGFASPPRLWRVPAAAKTELLCELGLPLAKAHLRLHFPERRLPTKEEIWVQADGKSGLADLNWNGELLEIGVTPGLAGEAELAFNHQDGLSRYESIGRIAWPALPSGAIHDLGALEVRLKSDAMPFLVTGRVTDASGLPLKSARIEIFYGSNRRGSAVSDELGRFRIREPILHDYERESDRRSPPELWRIAVRHPAHQAHEQSFAPGSELEVALRKGGRLSGRIRVPLELKDALEIILLANDSGKQYHSRPDVLSGDFSFNQLRPGSYRFLATINKIEALKLDDLFIKEGEHSHPPELQDVSIGEGFIRVEVACRDASGKALSRAFVTIESQITPRSRGSLASGFSQIGKELRTIDSYRVSEFSDADGRCHLVIPKWTPSTLKASFSPNGFLWENPSLSGWFNDPQLSTGSVIQLVLRLDR